MAETGSATTRVWGVPRAGLALSWAMGFNDDTPPVLPRHLEDGSPASAELRQELLDP